MVDNVLVNDAVEEVLANKAKVTVDGSESSLDKGPAVGLKVVDIGVGVVEVGDGDEPVMNPHVGGDVQEKDSPPAKHAGGEVDGIAHNGQAEIGQSNEDGLAGTEDGAGGLKVAHAQPAGGLALLADGAGRDVEEEIHLPSGNLMGDELEQRDDGRVLEQLGVEVQVGQAALALLRDAAGDKHHVLLHVAGEAMVAVVGELPAEVGHHEERVGEPADNVVDHLVGRERAVAALVGQDPQTGAEQALDVAVDNPGDSLRDRVLDLRDEGQAGPAKRRDHDQVANEIAERPHI